MLGTLLSGCKRNMVQSGRNKSTAKADRQPQKNICSCSKRRSTRVSLFSSVHGWCRIFALLLCPALLMTGKATKSKVKEPIPITSSAALKLKRCFTGSQSVTFRATTMNNGQGCQDGTFYLCGYDATKTYIIESCQPDKECIPGTTHMFVAANGTFKLECHPCDTGWFEPEFSKSSRSSQLAGCSYQHKPSSNISRNLVLFENGTASHATRWYCDNRNGYYEENGNICDDVPTKPCNCIHKTCKQGYLLRLDGICVRCNTHLDPHNNFRCVQENGLKDNLPLSTSTGSPAKLQQSDDENPLQHNMASHAKVDSDSVTSVIKEGITPGEASNEVEGIPIVAVVIVFLLTPLGILCVCVCFCGSRKDEKEDDFKHLMTKDDESFADPIMPKYSFDDVGPTKIQINATGSRDVHIGDQHTHLNNIETTDNSKAIHNGNITNKTIFKTCIINNIGQTEHKISPTRNGEPRIKKSKYQQPMTTLNSDDESSLEMDHESDIAEGEMPDQRMTTLKFYSLERGSIENDGLQDSILPSRREPDGESIDQTHLKQPFRET